MPATIEDGDRGTTPGVGRMQSRRLKICRRCQRINCVCRPTETKQLKRSSSRGGYDGWWRTYSEWYRQANPFCVACEAAGRSVLVEVVDHIVPFHRPDGSIDDELRRDPANHQSLCHECHNGPKKAIEIKHAGNGETIKRAWQMHLAELRDNR